MCGFLVKPLENNYFEALCNLHYSDLCLKQILGVRQKKCLLLKFCKDLSAGLSLECCSVLSYSVVWLQCACAQGEDSVLGVPPCVCKGGLNTQLGDLLCNR